MLIPIQIDQFNRVQARILKRTDAADVDGSDVGDMDLKKKSLLMSLRTPLRTLRRNRLNDFFMASLHRVT